MWQKYTKLFSVSNIVEALQRTCVEDGWSPLSPWSTVSREKQWLTKNEWAE